MTANLLPVFAVAVALGADAFSVALGLGMTKTSRTFRIRFVLTVAALHVIMPLLGLMVGQAAGTYLGRWATALGALVLAFIGMQMLHKGMQTRNKPEPLETKPAEKKTNRFEAKGWGGVLLLAVSVSIDALTVGFGLGALHTPIPLTVALTGSIAGLMTALGWLGGRFSGGLLGHRALLFGGVILVVIAIKMVLL